MAFSTQKEFLHVAFMNERLEPKCVRMEGVKLKTYASTPDERAWSLNKDKQAQYLIDLVTCRTYPDNRDCGDDFTEHYKAGPKRVGSGSPCAPCRSRSPCQPAPCSEGNLDLGDDSLIHLALGEMTKLEGVIAEKDDLQSQLEVSKEKIRILNEEKQTITEILNDNHYPEMSCDFKKQVDRLKCASKIDRDDENELLKILDSLLDREKAYKVLDAENCYLRRLVEKLSLRGRLGCIPIEPETSTDVSFLQCEINNLRKEVSLLRSIEDKNLQKETVSRGSQGITPSDKDADNIAKIIAERNVLRDKCHTFATIECKIVQWKNDSDQLQCLRQEACCALKKKNAEIQDCHDEIEELRFQCQKMEKCFKAKAQEEDVICTTLDCVKEENRRLREEICRYKCDLKKLPVLQNQVQCLNSELCEKNCIIDQYDMQFQQLLNFRIELDPQFRRYFASFLCKINEYTL